MCSPSSTFRIHRPSHNKQPLNRNEYSHFIDAKILCFVNLLYSLRDLLFHILFSAIFYIIWFWNNNINPNFSTTSRTHENNSSHEVNFLSRPFIQKVYRDLNINSSGVSMICQMRVFHIKFYFRSIWDCLDQFSLLLLNHLVFLSSSEGTREGWKTISFLLPQSSCNANLSLIFECFDYIYIVMLM